MLACAAPAQAGGAQTVETVRFADPRWPAVRIVRGPAANVAAPTVAPAAPIFSATPANTEIVTFGDGTGRRVQVVRGPGLAPAPSPPPPSPPRLPETANGRVETVRFDALGLPAVNVIHGGVLPDTGLGLFGPAQGGELDRVAFAVDGVESGHGRNPAMWRSDLDGPQGPMQVSAAAALDVGGGDRFDMQQNRLLGRAFLAKLYEHYGNWPDAIAAYNWGPGHLDQWIAAGRPADMLPLETARYLLRVMRDAFLLGPVVNR